MFDYRNKATDSPLIWCTQCKQLRPNVQATLVMTTVFRVDPLGVFPFGVCQEHAINTAVSPVLSQNISDTPHHAPIHAIRYRSDH